MFAILGANGNAGLAAAHALRQRGLAVRAVLRDPGKAAPLEALGCSIAYADIRDAQALRAALDGVEGVQAICPVAASAQAPLVEMRAYADAVAQALRATRPARLVAISDYGAEIGKGGGITLAFHAWEALLREAHPAPVFLRSAEHMQNWARIARSTAQSGVLASFHQPLSKLFPMVSATDVGAVAAEILAGEPAAEPHVVYVEGPRRYTPLEVAETFAHALGRPVVASEIPPADVFDLLTRGGVPAGYAALIVELYVAHNAGRIEIEPGATDIRRGPTEFADLPMFAKLRGGAAA